MRAVARHLEAWVLSRPRPVVAYGAAFALAVSALLARLAIDLWAPNALLFPTFYPAILLAAAIGGAGPGIVAVAVSLLSGWYFLLPPKLSFAIANPATTVSLVMFVLMALLLVAAGSLLRRVIHRQQLTEEQLRHTQERLQGALHVARAGTWRWAVAGDELRIDSALRMLLELPPDHGLRRIEDLWSLMPELSDREQAAAQLEHCLRGGGDFETEFRTRSEDGRERWWEMRARPKPLTDGTPARVVGGVVEVTKRHLAEVALWEAVAARDLLLQEVNHRIKNSLQLVASLLRLQASRAGKDARRSLEQAETRIMAVAALHRDLYQHHRYDSVEMRGYLQGLATQITGSLGGAAADDLIVDADEVALPTDSAVPIGLIVNELVTNAIKHGYRGGRGSVAIRLRAADGVRIEVEDHGRGVPPDFDPGSNTGLGMTIVMALAKQIGARLVIEPVKRGTRFVLHLGTPRVLVDRIVEPNAA